MSVTHRTLAIVSGVAAWTATEAAAAEYQCRKDDSSLRIAVEVKKAGHTLPCEVIAEDDRGERVVLYSAQFDRNYCPARIDETRVELVQDGWSCQQTSLGNVVGDISTTTSETRQQVTLQQESAVPNSDGEQATAKSRVVAATRQCRKGADSRLIQVEVEDPNSGKPCEVIFWADGDQSKLGERLWHAEHDPSFCPRRLETIVGKWISDGWQCEVGDVQTAEIVVSPDASANRTSQIQHVPADQGTDADKRPIDPALEAVVAADAERIGEWMEVEPAIEIAAHGDLNDDGADDAVVFLAYQSDQAAYRQYLMSYLVADDGYELASVKLLTGASPPPEQARVDDIEKGVIWLTLPDKDGSTPEQTGYKLHDQQLVEVEPGSASADN